MADAIQVPLWAAILVPVLSGVGSAAITGIVTYKVTDRAVKAESDRHQDQLDHERFEAQKTRITAQRNDWLIPLRGQIAKYAKSMGTLAVLWARNDSAIRSRAQKFMQSSGAQLQSEMDAIDAISSELTETRFRGSDPDLELLLTEFGPEAVRIATDINNTADQMIKESDDDKKDDLNIRLGELVAEFSSALIPINKRIEELAAGVDIMP